VIDEAGTYTVTLSGDVDLVQLVLGADTGTQTLDTDGYQLRFNDGGLLGGAELVASGSVIMQGDVVWTGGTITGSGQVALPGGAELHAVGNPLELEARVDNRGTLTVGAGASLRINRLFESGSGAIIDLQGDAIITVQNSGNLSSTGTIRKRVGDDEAAILTSSAEFSSTGSLRVDAGSLWISGGSLRGTIEIDEKAKLRQTSDTEILNVDSLGDGPFEIGGSVTIGTSENQIVTFRHIILDSNGLISITGPAALLIDNSFIWRRGAVHELGSLNTQVGSQTTFERTGTSTLSATTWNVRGDVSGDSNVDLDLANGAAIRIEGPGRWYQSTGGAVNQGQGSAGSFEVIGEFHKTEEGAFVVGTSFFCSGTLNLPAGTLTVQNGDFNLLESGVITGGGTADVAYNRRLIVLDARTAVMSGTIRPGLEDGTYARMDIQGVVDLASTFGIELDVVIDGEFDTESVFFLSAGQLFAGTLVLNVQRPATPGVDYRVIYSNVASGEFTVTGDEQFDEVIQYGEGVICRQN